MLLNLIKKSYRTIIDAPVITLFLVVFLIVSNSLAPFAFSAKSKIVASILLICLYLLTAGFLAGWFNMFKDTAKMKEDENIREKKYLPVFLEGVGKNFIPVSLGLFINFIILISFILLTSFISSKLFGGLDFVFKDLINAPANTKDMMDFINNLSDSQKFVLYGWQILFMIAGGLFNFLFLFYFPCIVNDEKTNMFLKPLKAVLSSLQFIFRNFLFSILLYASIGALYIVMQLIKVFAYRNEILQLIILFILIYSISIVIMLIFNCYEQKNSCPDGSDRLGENEISDNTGKED